MSRQLPPLHCHPLEPKCTSREVVLRMVTDDRRAQWSLPGCTLALLTHTLAPCLLESSGGRRIRRSTSRRRVRRGGIDRRLMAGQNQSDEIIKQNMSSHPSLTGRLVTVGHHRFVTRRETFLLQTSRHKLLPQSHAHFKPRRV